jgi:[ribosomal protein S5]-alanine N-acetyltransferase
MELKGTGFTLRGWELSDAASLQKHADNINISSNLLDRFPSPYTLETAINWIKEKLDQNPITNFAIAVDGQVIGVIGLDFRDDVYRKTPLLGYWVSEQYWGKGIMTEAVKLTANYAFANFDVVRIQAGILSKNPASMRVLEKAGFIKEGIMRNAIIKHGEIMDEHIYAILKN